MKGISDRGWETVKPLIPEQGFKVGGRPRADDRNTLNAILWVKLQGKHWGDLPEEFGSYVTAWRRYVLWKKKGIWGKIVAKLIQLASTKEKNYLEKIK